MENNSPYSTEFESFIDWYNAGNYPLACEALISELGKTVFTHRSDFVSLLNNSRVVANEKMSDEKLIELFIENAPLNKELCMGASMLVNINNKKLGADGEEAVNDEAVKAGYEVLQEQYSGFIPLIAAALKGGAKLAGNAIKNKQAQQAQQSAAAKAAMLAAAKKKREAAAKVAAAKKKKKNLLIGGIITGMVLLVAGVSYAIYRHNKS